MPQFDLTWFPSQILWLVVLFFVLTLLMYLIAVPLVSGTIERRAKRIDDDLVQAGKLKAEIDLVIAAREKSIAESRAQAADLLRTTKDRLAHAAAEKQREVAAALNAQIKSAEHRIELAKTKALIDVHAAAIDIVMAVTDRLVGPDMLDCSVAKIVDDVIGSRA